MKETVCSQVSLLAVVPLIIHWWIWLYFSIYPADQSFLLVAFTINFFKELRGMGNVLMTIPDHSWMIPDHSGHPPAHDSWSIPDHSRNPPTHDSWRFRTSSHARFLIVPEWFLTIPEILPRTIPDHSWMIPDHSRNPPMYDSWLFLNITSLLHYKICPWIELTQTR